MPMWNPSTVAFFGSAPGAKVLASRWPVGDCEGWNPRRLQPASTCAGTPKLPRPEPSGETNNRRPSVPSTIVWSAAGNNDDNVATARALK